MPSAENGPGMPGPYEGGRKCLQGPSMCSAHSAESLVIAVESRSCCRAVTVREWLGPLFRQPASVLNSAMWGGPPGPRPTSTSACARVIADAGVRPTR
jgi:hypothetical protein